MVIPFRYKLSALIVFLLLSVLAGSFVLVQRNLEDRFRELIREDLDKTQKIVAKLMERRFRALAGDARILRGARLVRDILTDRTLDRGTADDLVADEILPEFPSVELLMVISPGGKTLASSALTADMSASLLRLPALERDLGGLPGTAHQTFTGRLLQLVAVPVFLREELIGVLLVGNDFRDTDLAEVKAMSGAELAIFAAEGGFVLSTDWGRTQAAVRKALLQSLEGAARDLEPDAIGAGRLAGERFLFALGRDPSGLMPDYLLGQSLDLRMAFTERLGRDSLWVAAAVSAAGVVLSVLFSVGVSRPLARLRRATDAVEQDDYAYRVAIHGRDEFAALGRSFNRMMEGLQERERIRGVMNKIVSSEIAAELLDGDLRVAGSEVPVTLLCLRLDNWRDLVAGLPPDEHLRLLNDFLTRAHFAVEAHRGIVDQDRGDGLLAVFGVPRSHGDDLENARLAAADLHSAAEQFNLDHGSQLGESLKVTVRLESGTVLAGNLGPENRVNYTVFGPLVDAVCDWTRERPAP